MRAIHPSRIVVLALAALFTILALFTSASADTPPPPFVLIVHPGNPHGALDRGFVAEAFLKKTTRWPNGDVIKPADLPPESPVRERFSQEVLKRSVPAVKSYWQQIIFSGRDVPPPELPTDEDVVKYVLTHKGAIGYVSGNAHLGDARVVTIR